MTRNTAPNHRKGAVRNRSQIKNPVTGEWIKFNDEVGERKFVSNSEYARKHTMDAYQLRTAANKSPDVSAHTYAMRDQYKTHKAYHNAGLIEKARIYNDFLLHEWYEYD